ncbi:MAG: YCF48-related protein [Candidatus Eisenbacteria bacterium]
MKTSSVTLCSFAAVLLLTVLLPRHCRADGWAVGPTGLRMHSADAGSTWAKDFPTTSNFNNVFFLNDDRGWIVGNQVVYRTTTGGDTWISASNPYILNSVFFVNSTTGWAVGNQAILKSTDGGATWVQQVSTPNNFYSVHAVDTNHAWAVGCNVRYRTTDGGNTWDGDFVIDELQSVFFINSNKGWIVGNQVIERSTDGGVTWEVDHPTPYNFMSVYFVSEDDGVAAGDHLLWITHDSGDTWERNYPSYSLHSVWCLGDDYGWAMGTSGVQLRTHDFWDTWDVTFPGGPYTVKSVCFTSIPVAVTVGTVPSGRSFSADGAPYSSQHTFRWNSSSSHTVGTTSPQSGGSNTRYVWESWSDGGAIIHAVSVPISDNTYTAHFDTQYYLTMNAGTGGSVSPSSGWRDAGDEVTIEAYPAGGYIFDYWQGTGSGSYGGHNNPASITMSGPITETARFDRVVSVVVNTNPDSLSFTVDGVAYMSEQTFTWGSGDSHTIGTSSPQSGGSGTRYLWTSWSDGGAITHTVSPTSNQTFTAHLDTQYYLTMVAAAGGSVTPSSDWHDAGDSVTISASADSGFRFEAWAGVGNGSYSGSDNPATITLNGPISETAAFSGYQIALMGYRAHEGAGEVIEAHWATGNLGNTWDEGEWIPYQVVIEDIAPGLAGLDSIVVSFDFTCNSSGEIYRFIDLVRSMQVRSAPLDDTQGWPEPDGTPFPVNTRSEIEAAQSHGPENTWAGFVMLDLPDDQLNRQLDGGLDLPPGEPRHIFKIYRDDLIAAGVDINSTTIAVYFQLHESRSFVWMNQLQAEYDTLPAVGWGGYLYGADGWPTAASLSGSGYVPGLSGHVHVEVPEGSPDVPIPIPDWPAGVVSGFKWGDSDSDAVWDVGEAALAGWAIHVFGNLEQTDFNTSMLTNLSGYYSFENLTCSTAWILKEDAQPDASPGSTHVQTYPRVNTVKGLGTGIAVTPPPAGVADVGWEVLLTLDTMVQDSLNFGNSQSVSGITLADADIGLGVPFPNPCAHVALLSYSIPVASRVVMRIYNVQGQPVRTLVDCITQPGHHNTMWNGRDDSGVRVAPGIYVCRMVASGYEGRRKVILLD